MLYCPCRKYKRIFNNSENLIIKYQAENPEKLNGIKLNSDSATDLDCVNKNNVKECIVPQSHFNESGYYYTYYTNSLGDKVISYEIPKIQITLKKKKMKVKLMTVAKTQIQIEI